MKLLILSNRKYQRLSSDDMRSAACRMESSDMRSFKRSTCFPETLKPMLLKARITRVLVPEILKKIPRSKGRRFVALLRVKARIEMQTSTA